MGARTFDSRFNFPSMAQDPPNMKAWLRQDVLRHSHVTLPRAVGISGMLWASRILKKSAGWRVLKSPHWSAFAIVHRIGCLEHQQLGSRVVAVCIHITVSVTHFASSICFTHQGRMKVSLGW